MAFLYPNDWKLPLWLAALFGPFLGIRMGFDGAFWFVLLSIAAATPMCFRINAWSSISALLGIILWLYTGFMGGLWLDA